MVKDIYFEKSKKNRGTIVAYLNVKKQALDMLKRLHNEGVKVLVENCKICISDLEKCISETIDKNTPYLILIEHDKDNDGILLYEKLKEEGNIENIPVVIVGDMEEELKLKAVKIGALDFISDCNSEVTYIKIKNLIEIGKIIVKMRTHDNVTGTYTKEHGENIIRKSIVIAKEEKEDFSIIMVEIDNVKEFIEKEGKEKRNDILRQCANIFKAGISIKDFVYRYEEYRFILTFRDKSITEILNIAIELQYEVRQINSKYEINISFSGGIASLNSQVTEYEELIARSLESMSTAKIDGGARTYINDLISDDENKRNILIVYEDPIIKNVMVKKYTNKGYKVYQAVDYENSLLILKDIKIELIIIEFPAITITELQIIKDIKERNRHIKIIVISLQKSEIAMQSVLKNGADEYIQKPFSIVELELRMNKLIG